MIIGIIADLFLADPKISFHPIALIGRLIAFLEKYLYRMKNKKLAGFFLVIFVLFLCGAVVEGFYCLIPLRYIPVMEAVFVFFLFSSATLRIEARKIEKSLREETIEESRKRLSMIVGRQTDELTKEEIMNATIETVAENTSDGIIAVGFYLILGKMLSIGILLAVLFKAINTMDSMVGYQSDKYKDFGFFAAKIDDLVGIIPARLSGMFYILTGFGYPQKRAWEIFVRDRKNHKSPNAAHCEAAVAGLLGIQLGGDHYYFGKLVHKDSIGDSVRKVEIEDIKRTNNLMVRVSILNILLVVLSVYLMK